MDFDFSRTEPHDIYNLLIGLVAPRPIALVTSRNAAGQLNAAPFSSYNYVAVDPPMVFLGIAPRPGPEKTAKDTARNIRETGEFVVNVVNEPIAQAMNICAVDFPYGVSELEAAGLKTEPSQIVSVPRLAQAPASLECREFQTIEVGNSRIVLGRVVAVHVKDEFVDPAGPYIRAEALHAIGRMNGKGAYVRTRDAFLHIERQTYPQWKATHP